MREEKVLKEDKPAETTVSFISLGCFKNLVDTEVLGGLLEQHSIRLVSPYESSDWVVINTCGFIRDAKEESIDEILATLEKKENGEIKHVAVFGCLTQRYRDDLKENFKEADIIWGVNDLEELAELIASYDQNEITRKEYKDQNLFLYSHQHKRIITSTPNVAFIKISEGCNMKCSFCAIPQIRGPFRSRTIDDIVKEAERYKALGFHEVNLISQNSTYFGKDRNKNSELPALLEALSKLGFFGIRVLYLMPEEVDSEIIDAFNHPTIIPYFDLPFQHVSPPLLKRMNRSGNTETNARMIAAIRKKYRHAVIRSSFIVGFPGETEEHFNQLLSFAKVSRIERIGVFCYSDEENTDAFGLTDKVEPHIAELRKELLMDQSDLNIESYNEQIISTTQEFLPLGPCAWDSSASLGRIKSQAPDTDGLTIVNVPFEDDFTPYSITITDAQNELLYGEPE